MYELLASLLNGTANHRRARDTKCQKGRCQLRQNKKILSIQSRHTIDSAKCPLFSFRRHIDSIFKHLEKVEKSFRWSCHVFERNWGKILPKISAVGRDNDWWLSLISYLVGRIYYLRNSIFKEIGKGKEFVWDSKQLISSRMKRKTTISFFTHKII